MTETSGEAFPFTPEDEHERYLGHIPFMTPPTEKDRQLPESREKGPSD